MWCNFAHMNLHNFWCLKLKLYWALCCSSYAVNSANAMLCYKAKYCGLCLLLISINNFWSLLTLLNSVFSHLLCLYFSSSFTILFSKSYSSIFILFTTSLSILQNVSTCRFPQPQGSSHSKNITSANLFLQTLTILLTKR